MKCPKCDGELAKTTGHHHVTRCTNCQGLWFRTEDLRKLRRDDWMADYILDVGKPGTGKKYDQMRVINCPQCATPMTAEKDEKQPHIRYETCPKGHGTFFDAGEFKDLVKENFWDKVKDLMARKD